MREEIARERRKPSTPRPADVRDDYERDRARLVHSPSFRRLQAKTQVLGPTEGDFHRTRLTHSMEAAQIARGIVLTLRRNHSEGGPHLPSMELIETICFAHDLGHPPFGHGGERALNYVMRHFDGFEGNGQTLRIITNLDKHTEGFGLNLTRRAMLGVIKYPAPFSKVVRTPPADLTDQRQLGVKAAEPPKCYLDTESKTVDWILSPFSSGDRELLETTKEVPGKHAKTVYKALDTTIMEIADDIAYGIHDLEDMIALRLLDRERTRLIALMKEAEELKLIDVPSEEAVTRLFNGASLRGDIIGGLVNRLVNRTKLIRQDAFNDPLLAYSAKLDSEAEGWLKEIKKLVYKCVVGSVEVLTLEYRGQQIILDLFAAYMSDPNMMLPEDYSKRIAHHGAERAVCDYIAGMTDSFASRLHHRLYSPGGGTVFERL